MGAPFTVAQAVKRLYVLPCVNVTAHVSALSLVTAKPPQVLGTTPFAAVPAIIAASRPEVSRFGILANR